jgi:hypothetical protein
MQTRRYGDYRTDIYLDGLQGKLPRYPVDYRSLERAATEVLPPWVLSYVAGGAGDGNTQRANVEAFSRYAVVPRMLVGATERDLRCHCSTRGCQRPCSWHQSESSACALKTSMETSRRLRPLRGPECRWWLRR